LRKLKEICQTQEDTSSLYIAIYGVIAKITSFLMMPLFGIVQGFQPIVGFNYGAGNPKRVREALKLSIISSVVIASAMFIVVMIFSKFAISLFNTDVNLIFYGQKPLRFFIMLLPVVNVILIASGLFQSIGKAIPSLLLALSRQVIFLIPLIFLLSILFGLEGIWWSFPLADFISIIASIIWIRLELKTPQMIVTNTN
jgi:Na+-driven multidrug efflux pump